MNEQTSRLMRIVDRAFNVADAIVARLNRVGAWIDRELDRADREAGGPGVRVKK